VHAEDGAVRDLDLGYGTPDELVLLEPELSGVGLWFGIRGPVVADMFVLAGDLAAVAAVADSDIDNESLH